MNKVDKNPRIAEVQFKRGHIKPLKLDGLSRLAADYARHLNFVLAGTGWGIRSIFDYTQCSAESQRLCGRVGIALYKMKQTPAGVYLEDYDSGTITIRKGPYTTGLDDNEREKIEEDMRRDPIRLKYGDKKGKLYREMKGFESMMGNFNFSKYGNKQA
jgi:hypothetical protein